MLTLESPKFPVLGEVSFRFSIIRPNLKYHKAKPEGEIFTIRLNNKVL